MSLEFSIEYSVYQKVMYWVEKSPVEVSGMGKIIQKDGKLHITDAWLVEQENTSADTEMDAEAVSKLMFQTKDIEGGLNWWWHSHHTMGVFWSPTDTATIEQLGKNGYIAATVFNKAGKQKSAYLQAGDGFIPSIFIDDVPLSTIHTPMDEELKKQWDKEYDENCTVKTWGSNQGSWDNWGRNKGNGNSNHGDSGNAFGHWYDDYVDDDILLECLGDHIENEAEWKDAERKSPLYFSLKWGKNSYQHQTEIPYYRRDSVVSWFYWLYGESPKDRDEVEDFYNECYLLWCHYWYWDTDRGIGYTGPTWANEKAKPDNLPAVIPEVIEEEEEFESQTELQEAIARAMGNTGKNGGTDHAL